MVDALTIVSPPASSIAMHEFPELIRTFRG